MLILIEAILENPSRKFFDISRDITNNFFIKRYRVL